MPSEAIVSYFRWPYGCLASGGCRAIETPIRATTLEAESVSEWKPSEMMDTAPVE